MVCDKNGTDCVFHAYGMGDMPECCRQHLTETVHYTTWLLGLYGIKHWADYGTLLGAVREGGHIPWDSDGDFGILMKDRDTVMSLKKKVRQDGFHLHDSSPYVLQVVYSKWNWSYVELWCNEEDDSTNYELGWPTDSMPREYAPLDTRPIRRSMPTYRSGGPGTRNDHTSDIPCWWLDKMSTVNFGGKPIPAPRNPENFLDMRYGNWHDRVRKYEAYFGGNAWSMRQNLRFCQAKKQSSGRRN